MPKISNGRKKEIQDAARNRREIIAAQLTRRDMVKMGLLTSAGMLVPVKGLSARARDPRGIIPLDNPQSPPTTPFVDPMPRFTIKQPVAALNPIPTAAPNTGAGERRTRTHQQFAQFTPQKLYEVHQTTALATVSPQLPQQTLWGFDGIVPGPLYVAHYGEPILVRNFNDLPVNNGGFGKNEVSTHLHNGHTPSESDGFPCDFFGRTFWYDQHYPNVRAGFASTNPPNGDRNETLSSLWYHDHRIDFTAQNVYKGLAGMYNLFSGTNQDDTGDEGTGFHLPSFPEFDVNMIFGDRVFDEAGILAFDLFNTDGILGDKFLVNGKIQPFFQVAPRRYRFRWLNGGPSRFYQFFLTDPLHLNQSNQFWLIANDGNLLTNPVPITSTQIAVAERMDVIIDFSPFAGKSIYLENRLKQDDGRGPSGEILPAGQGNKVLRFDVVLPPVADNSVDPATNPTFFTLPTTPVNQARITRTFRFERGNGQWQVNGKFANCNDIRFAVKQNTSEIWKLQNNSGGWQHPIHIHFEEFQILSRNGVAPPAFERSRKDVLRLGHNEEVLLHFRFRDFLDFYPIHCHNVVHEDHAMMALFKIDTVGDNKTQP